MLLRRYEGLCRPTGRAPSWPTRWIVLACGGTAHPVEGRPRLRSTGLEQWAGAILTMRRSTCQLVERADGGTAGGCWRWLEDVLERPGNTWILSARALRDWALLGLWDRLEVGQVKLATERAPRCAAPHERGSGRQEGLLILADPPCAAGLQIGAAARRATWLCAGNYGWSAESEGGVLGGEVTRLVGALATTSAHLDRHRLGGWAITAGAMSYRAWRANYLKESLYVHNHPGAESLEQAASCGGRLYLPLREATCPAAYAADGRSLYPHALATSLYPIGLAGYHQDRVDARSVVRQRPSHACARVTVQSDRPRYPRRAAGRTEYPTGRFETVLCGAELQAAVREGDIDDVHEAAEYTLGSPCADYARAVYQMRLAADAAGDREAATLAKRLAVALPGKLAQAETVWESVAADYNDPMWGEWYDIGLGGEPVLYRSRAGQVSREMRAGLAACAVPQIPLWIWAYGRQWLWERLCAAHLIDVLYADTDGLITTEPGYRRLEDAGLIRPNEWGQLRYQGGPAPCEVRGAKCVRFGDKLIQAGAPRGQRGLESAQGGYWFRAGNFGSRERGRNAEWVEELRTKRGG